jgi:phosphoribosylformylglycinamidine synthase
VQATCLEAIQGGLLRSAHDCSHGGLAVALAECCIEGALGLDASELEVAGRLDASLFGEGQSRIVVSCATADSERLQEIAGRHGVSLAPLGRVGGDRLVVGSLLSVPVADMARAYREGLPRALDTR